MAKYYIGMHLKFDDNKYKRDYISDISGVELCNFSSKDEIQRMLELADQDGFEFGIHFPLDVSSYKYRDPLLLSLNHNERIEAMEAIEQELIYASEIGAEYILIHFPKPIIGDTRLAWDKCNFKYTNEFFSQADYPYELFKKRCYEAFEKLTDLSYKHEIQVVLEIEMLNQYLYEGPLLEELLIDYPDIKLCLDSSRLHILSQIDNNFDMWSFAKRYAKYTYSLHIANIQFKDKISNGHYPALQNLSKEEGWCDVERFIDIVSSKNQDVTILFEHRSDLISDQELKDCYKWIMGYFEKERV